jgi:beta-phosphoglucomutase
MMKKAFIFDLNGTMIDDMSYHLDIWYTILTTELGATLTRAKVRSHMYGKNQEVLERIFGTDRFSKAEAEFISQNKEERYQAMYRPDLRLLPGLKEFLKAAKGNGVLMAIGSAASPFINFVLDNLELHHYFYAV